MKTIFAVALTLLSLSAVAAPTLEGNWALTERVCTDGKTPQDRFNPATDSMQVNFSGGNVTTKLTFGGCTFDSKTTYTTSGMVLTMGAGTLTSKCSQPTSFEAEKTMVYVTDSEMLMFHANFGDGGSCAKGEGIIVKFKRVP